MVQKVRLLYPRQRYKRKKRHNARCGKLRNANTAGHRTNFVKSVYFAAASELLGRV